MKEIDELKQRKQGLIGGIIGAAVMIGGIDFMTRDGQFSEQFGVIIFFFGLLVSAIGMISRK